MLRRRDGRSAEPSGRFRGEILMNLTAATLRIFEARRDPRSRVAQTVNAELGRV